MANKTDAEMAALASMTPETGQEPAAVDPTRLGKVDNTPKIHRDERLNQLAWIEVNRDIMLYKSMFYPTSWKFKARAALGAEIAAFSTIDSEDPMSVNDGINDILKSCLRIEDSTGGVLSFRNLCEFDRLWFLLFIRDLTMASTEQRITYEVRCPHCQEPNTVHLSFDNLVTTPLSELAQKYYNIEECAFIVPTKSFGILKFEPSTIYRGEAFKDWMLENRRQNRKDPSTAFAKLYPLLLDRQSERMPKAVNAALTRFFEISNDSKKLSLYLKLADALSVGLSQDITYCCESCEKEAQAPIQFPDGIGNLLLMSDISEELL